MDASQEFTDVWNYPSVRPYKGKHPAEKPAELLEHVIAATTRPGDIVLDCFSGSGSTAVAALRLGRLGIAIEIEHEWASRIASRIRSHRESMLPPVESNERTNHRKAKRSIAQLQLFAGGK
jgi:site-specific DNA-methyltransferase (adenine-specific)